MLATVALAQQCGQTGLECGSTVNLFILAEPKVSETEFYPYIAEFYISDLQDAFLGIVHHSSWENFLIALVLPFSVAIQSNLSLHFVGIYVITFFSTLALH